MGWLMGVLHEHVFNTRQGKNSFMNKVLLFSKWGDPVVTVGLYLPTVIGIPAYKKKIK